MNKEKTPKIKAYLNEIRTGKLTSNKTRVLQFIIYANGSDVETMRSKLNIAHQTLTSALSHLEDEGIIYKAGTTSEGNYTVYKYEHIEELQRKNAQNTHIAKFEAWKKRGFESFPDLMSKELRNQLKQLSLF